jgi:alpha-L-rhamnosidase
MSNPEESFMSKVRASFTSLFLIAALTVSCGLRSSRAQAPAGPGSPLNLRCEYLPDPLGVDTAQPRFSWVLQDSQRAEKQIAYQVLVATKPDLLGHDSGDQWDSGKVASEESTQVIYAGKVLQSGKTYYWKVRAWDKEGKSSEYSRTAHFGMGLLSQAEWKGSWIGGGSTGGNEFRKEFTLNGKVADARVYITALGYYELRVNGKRIGHNVLDPGWTTYPKRVLYSTYDISSALQEGPNVIAVMLGGGWATQKVNGSDVYYNSPALLVQMNAELAGGRQVSVASDASWKTTAGPIADASVYDGEVYDARRETPGWDMPGFADAGWSAAQVVEGSAGIRSSQMMQPIRVVDTIVPVKLTSPEPGVYVYDMGQNMSGWGRLQVEGPTGAKVTLRYAELLYDNGMINRENIREAKSRDIYILRGGEQESYEARFTYHGFRYVEVTGFPGTPSLDSVRGRVAHSAVNTVGSFMASKQILNDIQKLIRWSQLTNLFSVPTDCDQRDERQGWMGDAQATAEEAMMNFDMAAFYTNFIRDIADAQGADGALPSTVPRKYGMYPADLGWETAYPLLVKYMWEQYGDRRILEQNESGLKKYVEFLRSHAVDNVMRDKLGHEGDWVELAHTPNDYVADFWYYYDVQTLAGIEKTLGNSTSAESYARLATDIRDAFNRTYFHADTGQYANGTQAANAMALFLDMVPKDQRDAVTDNLTNDVLYFHDTHVTTGFIGVKFLLPALTSTGHSDLAYDLAVQTTYPSWGYMVSRGATTLWELWEEKSGRSMNSQDHIMFGSVGAWFYQGLAGINQSEGGAGYRHLRIQPQIVRDLHWASGTVDTIRGTVTSSWNHQPGAVTLQVTIPVGSDAHVVIPKADEMSGVVVEENGHVVWEKGHFVPGDPGVTSATEEDGNFAFEVGSGEYSFRLTGK